MRYRGVTNVVEKELRPKKPSEWYSNQYTWLSNFDIEKVMFQYEDKYKDFKFIGVFPIDFAAKPKLYFGSCVAQEMCNIKVDDLVKSGITQIAAVFNLDKHDQPGSHWVAVYSNLDPKKKNYGIYYYDSNGMEPPSEIVKFQESIAANMRQLHKGEFVIDHNRRRHQFGNSECGMFSMYFIERCLKGRSFASIVNSKDYDKKVHKYRDVYYRPSKYDGKVA
jgi:hypothetical protein